MAYNNSNLPEYSKIYSTVRDYAVMASIAVFIPLALGYAFLEERLFGISQEPRSPQSKRSEILES